MAKLYLIAAFILLSFVANSQGNVKGKIVDTANKKPLGLATITVFKALDTALITYRLSTPDGEFKVPGLPLNVPIRILVSYSGFSTYRKELTLTNNEAVDLGILPMTVTSNALEEVVVVAERPPVTVRQDTIEFNASSFKTLPTALVEDLLKKLPGVEVDREGNVMVGGKRVNRILVDGKSFFGDDPKMATRNLPANLIDKVQVADDKDEANRNTDGDLTNVGKVINLSLKKGVKKGWFGKVYGGAGTNERYEGGGIANIYRDTMQLSVIGFSNNVNRSGFSMKDVQDLGGFSRSGVNDISIYRRGGNQGFALNGVSFGGLDLGVSRTSGAGFNLNHAPNKKYTFFGQYFIGNNKNLVEELNNNQQFLNDTTVTTRGLTNTNRNINTHTLNVGANMKPDSLLDISVRASYNYSTTAEVVNANINVQNSKVGTVSTGLGNLFNSTFNNDYYHYITLTKRFKAKKGRTLNLYQNLSIRSNLQKRITESENLYYAPFSDTTLFEQLRQQEIPTKTASINASFAEPLGKKWTFRFNNRFEYLHDQQDIATYKKDAGSLKYNLPNAAQTSGFERDQNKFASTVSLTYKLKKVNLTAGVVGLWQNIQNQFKTTASNLNFSLFNVLPTASLTWKQLSLRVDQNVNAPAISYLNPVPDNSNPFFIRFGNPSLKPAKRTNININNFVFDQKNAANYNIYLNGSFTDNDVILSRIVKSNGVQETRPVNVNGTINFYSGVGFNKDFKKNPKFIVSTGVRPYMQYDKRKLLVNNNDGTATTISYGPAFTFGLNWNDVIEFRPEYRLNVSKTKYTDPSFTNLNVTTQYLESELIVRWPKKLVWETNIAYRSNSQVAPGLPKTNLLWNAALTLLMLKNDAGQLKLSVYDILNRNNYYSRFATQNSIVDMQSNVLNRYALLTFTYNIRNVGASKKVGGRDRMYFF